MKTGKIIFMMTMLFTVISLSASAQRSEFSGEWKINREKSVLPDNQLFLSRITFALSGDSLITTRVYENGYGEEYPFDEKMSLDGKDCNIVIFDMPRVSKAFFATNDSLLNIESKTTFNGGNGEEDLIAKEQWKKDPASGMLTMEFTNTMSGNDFKGTYYYTKSN